MGAWMHFSSRFTCVFGLFPVDKLWKSRVTVGDRQTQDVVFPVFLKTGFFKGQISPIRSSDKLYK